MAHDALRILLIEDDPILSEITGFRLELLGYEVVIVGSQDAAQQSLRDELPDVILLDLALANNEGLELLNRLSNDQRTSELPVLVFSTSADLDNVQRAYAAGADEYLVTPYDPANLEQKVEKLRAAKGARGRVKTA